MRLANGSEHVPGVQLRDKAHMDSFSQRWFDHPAAQSSNYIYLLGAQDEALNTFYGLAESVLNWSYVFIVKVGRDNKDYVRQVNHELVHQWGDMNDPNLDHDNELGHDGVAFSLMNPNTASMNRYYELSINRLYKLRDFVDDV